MKTIVEGVIGGLLMAGLGCSLYGQASPFATSGLVQISSPPAWGTFYVMAEPQGLTAPWPCPPGPGILPDPQFFLLPTGQYLVVSAGIDYSAPQWQRAVSQAASLVAQANLAAGPVSSLAQAGQLASEPGDSAGGTPQPASLITYPPGSFYLEVLSVGGSPPSVSLIIHGTTNGNTSQIISREALVSPLWNLEGLPVVSASGLNWMSASVPVGNRSGSLFLSAFYYADTERDGVPDWWKIFYFGPNFATLPWARAGADPAGDGLTNLEKYLLGLDPTVPDDGFQVLLTSPPANSAVP